MSKQLAITNGGVQKVGKKAYLTVDGVHRKVKKAYLTLSSDAKLILPDGYRQVESIESNGTQYIDTDYAPSEGTKIEVEFQYTSLSSQYSGVYISGAWFAFGIGSSNLEVYYGNKYITTSASTEKTTLTIDGVNKTANVNGTDFSFSSPTYTAGANSLVIFALRRSATNIADNCHMKLFSYRIYDKGTLVRNFIPCINPSGVVGLYDLVNAKFYGNSGTGVFTAGRKVYKESEIAKLEYIEGSGSQYIDSDYIPNSNTRVLMDVEATNTINGVFFGGRSSDTSNSFTLFSLNGVYRTDYGAQGKVTTISLASNVRRIIDKNKNVTTIDGTAYTITAATFTAPVSMAILAVNSAGTISYKISAKLYSCQIYDNGTLTRDYYPAEIDGAIGLWDAISGVLYTDAAGGTFIAGPEVENLPTLRHWLCFEAGADVASMSIDYSGDMIDAGIVTMSGKQYRLLTLTSSGTLTVGDEVQAEVWMCGGGAGGMAGDNNAGGNGGAGAYTASGQILLSGSMVATIGSGGAANTSANMGGHNGGGASSFGGVSTKAIASGTAASNGGTGGGGGTNERNAGTGDGVSKYPFNDATYFPNPHCAGGGGGGTYEWTYYGYSYAGGAGGTNGGDGSAKVSKGGTNAAVCVGGVGGTKGGGDGGSAASKNVYNGSAATYYGSGGGGAAHTSVTGASARGGGGAGYQGVIYIRIPVEQAA